MTQTSYVVTGGAQGVGAEIARRLARTGHVVVVDLVEELAWSDAFVELVELVVGDAGDSRVATSAARRARTAAWSGASITGNAGSAPAYPRSMHDGKSPPQVWHRYRMSHSINVAWLDHRVSSAQMLTLDDAWDVLVVREEWRSWMRAHMTPSFPFLYLAVREDVPRRRLRKTTSGASLQLPSAEVFRADAEGTLVDLFLEVIHDLHTRWADGHGYPAPPALPETRSSAGRH